MEEEVGGNLSVMLLGFGCCCYTLSLLWSDGECACVYKLSGGSGTQSRRGEGNESGATHRIYYREYT